ncbi:MAG TPA: dihydropteroate synthase [Anaerolineae bacterium]|nr:dihydropteroate synthase [Anaerolineae bacterium]
MQTILRGRGIAVTIGAGQPLVVIGNRIDAANPRLAEAIRHLDMERIRQEARAQAAEGAEVIAVQAHAQGIDQVRVLPALVAAVSEAVPLPVCILTENPLALAPALEACPGKPLVGSISGKAVALNELLPLASARGVAVVATALDDARIPRAYDDRVELMRNVLRAAILADVPRPNIILNPALELLSADPAAALTYLKAAAHLSRIEQLNVAVEPEAACGTACDDRNGPLLLALAVRGGVTCALGDPALLCGSARTIDLLLDRSGALGCRSSQPASG